MDRFKLYKEIVEKLPNDIRLEVILADMVLEGLEMDDVEIASNSIFRRNYHYDIEKVEEFEYPGSRRKRLRFVTNRDGIYDSLPENLFHQPVDKGRFMNIESRIDEMKLQEDREEAARKLFLPYEQEFFRLRVKLELEERNFMNAMNSQAGKSIASMLWDLPDFLGDDEKDVLGSLMPVMHRISGNFPLSSFIASKISGDKVEISKKTTLSNAISEDPVLSDKTLGIDFVLGGPQSSHVPSVNWDIWVSEADSLTHYLQNGKKAKIHEFLSNLMVPLENDLNIQLHLNEPSEGFMLNDDSSAGRLGYITYI